MNYVLRTTDELSFNNTAGDSQSFTKTVHCFAWSCNHCW